MCLMSLEEWVMNATAAMVLCWQLQVVASRWVAEAGAFHDETVAILEFESTCSDTDWKTLK